jgi:hypothetical protein
MAISLKKKKKKKKIIIQNNLTVDITFYTSSDLFEMKNKRRIFSHQDDVT